MSTNAANAGQQDATHGSIARMISRTVAAVTLTAVTLGGAAFAASDAGQPAARCKVVSAQTQTQATSSGVLHRTVTTSKCRGEKVVTYSTWS